MSNNLKTCIEGLDRVLCGGFLYHNSILLKGAPGCGKTTLGMQIVYNGAVQCDEPGIIVLFEQFPQQLYRDVMSYGWEIDDLVKQERLRVIFSTPEQVISKDKMIDPPLVAQIQNAAMEIGAKRILIDSVSHILALTQDPREGRDLLLRFINSLKSCGLTPFLTAEAENREGAVGVDEYLTDCVLLLSSEASKNKNFALREIAIRKTRGHDHMRGRHMMKLSEKGVEVFPRKAVSRNVNGGEATAERGLARLSSGIKGLDEMLGGGYTRGSSILVAGMPGTFKTTLGVQFVTKGAAADEHSLIISFAERADFLTQLMEEKGLGVRERVKAGQLALWHYSPKDIYIEELLHLLQKDIAERKVTRLFVDGINEIERSVEDPEAYKDVLTALLNVCAQGSVTSLFTLKIDQVSGNSPLANIRYASMFDGIVYLGTLEIESAVHRVISVLKMRGADFTGDLREITCGSDGLRVADKFVGLSGILSGNAQGQYKKTVEELFQPLYFIRDFIQMLAEQEVEPEQRKIMLANLKDESNKLVERLKTHFDIRN